MSQNYPLRVLHVIGRMDVGGAETMLMNLYRHINRKKVQFDFVENCSGEAFFDEEIKALGGRVYKCPRYKGFNIIEYINWWNSFFDTHQHDYKIIHGHIGSSASIYLKIAKKRGLYTIAHSHSVNANWDIASILYRIMAYPTRFIADDFFACSVDAGKNRFGKSITESEKFHIIKNAIDTRRFSFDEKKRESIRNELLLTEKYVIGHIGAFRKEKNHIFLLEIFREVLRKNDKAWLVLVGDGPLKKQIEIIAKEMGILDNVQFLGIREDVELINQALDTFVLPSLYEGIPVALIEAQTAGIPCIVSDVISDECSVGDSVIRLPLSMSAEEWADIILSTRHLERKSGARGVILAGYDINNTSSWIENYYLEHADGPDEQ